MKLKQLFQRWSKGEDARAVERAKEESLQAPHERGTGSDFEARKDDIEATRGAAGAAAADVASEDLGS